VSNPPAFRWTASLILALALSGERAADAQQKSSAPPTSLFRKVISQPTGQNGYEDLVLAGDALQASRYYEESQKDDLSLAMKRQILADRSVVRALELVRRALQKPVSSPRTTLSYRTELPELQVFRALARVLVLQQYVLLADGRAPEAIGVARTCLRMGQVIQQDTLIHGLVGMAVGAICLQSLGKHLDQLSARDCTLLYNVCTEWLSQPNPQAQVLRSERHLNRVTLTEIRELMKQKGPRAVAEELGADDNALSQLQAIPTAPEAVDALFTTVQKRLDEYYTRLDQELAKPSWERKPVEQEASDLAGHVAGFFLPNYQAVDTRYIQEAARMRLLASHCAIRRFRWEHNRLPERLAVLNLGELAVDPFTGQTLQYETRGTRYTLTSVGAPAPADDPKAVNGRLPVSITPAD